MLFGTLCPFCCISQHRTLLSHEPAMRKDVLGTEGGENLRQEMESSGGFVTSRSFIGLGWFPSPRLIPPVFPLPKLDDPNELWPNILRRIRVQSRFSWVFRRCLFSKFHRNRINCAKNFFLNKIVNKFEIDRKEVNFASTTLFLLPSENL